MEVHGAQEFRWGPLVIAGEIATRASVKDIYEHDGRGFYIFETVSVNQRRRDRLHRHTDRHRQKPLTSTPTQRDFSPPAAAFAQMQADAYKGR